MQQQIKDNTEKMFEHKASDKVSLLTHLSNYHCSDKGTIHGSRHQFSEVYATLDAFKDRQKPINILEVGVFQGASLRTYYDYFPNAKIVGLDLFDMSCYENDRISCYIIDQSDDKHLKQFVKSSNIEFDIIIDDGSHHMKDQQITFYYLSQLLKKGGIYIIEDLHTSFGVNGADLYGKPLDIRNNGENTTYNLLINRPFKSIYLTPKQNEWLTEQFGDSIIYGFNNELVPSNFGGVSMTSVITKK